MIVFQFHNGSIKRGGKIGISTVVVMFQFHNGSIKSDEGQHRSGEPVGFQFHNGSIKSRPHHPPPSFNRVSIPQWFD